MISSVTSSLNVNPAQDSTDKDTATKDIAALQAAAATAYGQISTIQALINQAKLEGVNVEGLYLELEQAQVAYNNANSTVTVAQNAFADGFYDNCATLTASAETVLTNANLPAIQAAAQTAVTSNLPADLNTAVTQADAASAQATADMAALKALVAQYPSLQQDLTYATQEFTGLTAAMPYVDGTANPPGTRITEAGYALQEAAYIRSYLQSAQIAVGQTPVF